MAKHDAEAFHRLYGIRKPRTCYYRRDFADYTLMLLATASVAGLAYGFRHGMALAAFVLCAFTLPVFIVRHGVELRVPLILRRPQDVLYLVFYKLRNLKPVWFVAVGLLLLENVLIAATPKLPHQVEWMRIGGLVLFYAHFAGITLYRTVIFADHLKKKELVREILMQTPWKRTINRKTNITLEVVHAYVTGLLAHIIYIAPWYFVIVNARFSLLLFPVVFLIDAAIEGRWAKTINRWFYRDHWLGHNSELEFLYLHGNHHDAIPSAMIAVGENGFLEGAFRNALGAPAPFYNPLAACLFTSYAVWVDMFTHQYIPGVYPRLSKLFLTVAQHATHHFGQLAPYSFAMKTDQPGLAEQVKSAGLDKLPNEMRTSIELDEELTGFQWDNPTYRKTLDLYEQYNRRKPVPEAGAAAAVSVPGSPS
jgi:hypothetical protein